MTAGLLCLIMFLVTCGALLGGFPVAFTLAGSGLIFAGLGALLGLSDLGLLAAFPQRIFQVMSSEVLVAVPLFVFMGLVLERSRIAEDLLGAMAGLFGRLPGGLGYAVFIVGALLAASTGIAGAAVVTLGVIALPVMLRAGYSPALASGAVAASGTLGQVIPPSIVLILLGDQLSAAYSQAQFAKGVFNPDSITVNELFAGALLPGLMLVGLYILFMTAYAAIKPASLQPVAQNLESQTSPGVLFAPLLLIVAVLGSILGGLASASEAAGLGALGALLLAGHRHSKGLSALIATVAILLLLVMTHLFDLRAGRDTATTIDLAAIAVAVTLSALATGGLVRAILALHRARSGPDQPAILQTVMRGTVRISSMIFMILLGAALFSLTFRGLGGDRIVASLLQDLPGGAYSALLLVMIAIFLLGFFLDILEIIFIVVPVVAPVLLAMEIAPDVTISPVWLGVLIALNLQTAFLTPPFGFALFYLRGAAPESLKTRDIYRGVAPFVALQLIALTLLAVFPGLATWLPGQLFN